MSAAEGFNFGSALSGIVKSASKVVSDPTFAQIVRTAAPIAGGALGTVIGGPLGGALGSQLGNLAAQALPTPAGPPTPVAPPVPRIPQALTVPRPGLPTPSPVAGGSAAAAQGLVLTQQPELLRSLLATALGQQGRQQVSGLPVAQILRMFGEVIEQAAADADELMYLGQQPDAAESAVEAAPPGSSRSLYGDLLGADNLEFAEAVSWEGLD
jgi:hypothetical protein